MIHDDHHSLLFTAIIVVLCLHLPVAAQQCDPADNVPALAQLNEVTLDDTWPWEVPGTTGPIEYTQTGALKVAAVNLDGDWRKDIIVGGNGSNPTVRIHYLGANWQPTCDGVGLPLVDPSSGKGSSACYDFEVVDVDGDGWQDIVVGRLLNCCQVRDGETDTVFLNAGKNFPPNSSGCTLGLDWFPLSDALEIPNPTADSSAICNPSCQGGVLGHEDFNRGATFGLALGEIDDVPGPDLVTCGANYSVRYFQNDGLGVFTWAADYVDGTDGNCRDVQLVDVDDDGDLDLFVSRVNADKHAVDWEPNRVWFNTRFFYDSNGVVQEDPLFNPADPFEISPQLGLQWGQLDVVSWVESGTGCNPSTNQMFETPATHESQFADLDTDGDLDLVCAVAFGRGVAYLNNGRGFFGSLNTYSGPGDMNNSCPAFEFDSITPSWTGQSNCLFQYVELANAGAGQPSPFPSGCGYANYVFTVPGSVLNTCTGVAIADMNGDHLPDIGFSNRNDWEDSCVFFGGLAYFDSGAPPDVYDYIVFNNSTPGVLDFTSCVERIEKANDGTGYGEFVSLNNGTGGDRRPEWLDANFNNFVGTGPSIGKNKLYWGRPLLPSVQCDVEPAGVGQGLALSLAADAALAGLPYVVLASGTGIKPSFSYGGSQVGLAYDLLTSGILAGSYSDLFGWLDKDGAAWVEIAVPAEWMLVTDTVWLAAVVMVGDSATYVSNTVAVGVSP